MTAITISKRSDPNFSSRKVREVREKIANDARKVHEEHILIQFFADDDDDRITEMLNELAERYINDPIVSKIGFVTSKDDGTWIDRSWETDINA